MKRIPGFASLLASVALILTLADPAPGAEYRDSVKVRPLLDTETTTLGQKLAYPASSQARIVSSIVELAPGAETGRHRHPVPLYGYVLEGAIRVEYEGGQVRTFKAGDAFMEAVNTWHNGKNTGEVPVKLLTVYLSAKGQKLVENAGK